MVRCEGGDQGEYIDGQSATVVRYISDLRYTGSIVSTSTQTADNSRR